MQTLFFATEKPSYPTSAEQQSATSRSVNVTWKVGYDGNSPIVSYKIEMKEAIKSWNAGNYFIVDGNKTFYTIRDLIIIYLFYYYYLFNVDVCYV